MRGSYFSRIAAPVHSPMLLPPRPIATLWKAARLERLSGEKGLPQSDAERISIGQGHALKGSRSTPVIGLEKDDSPVRSGTGEAAFLPKQKSELEVSRRERSRPGTTLGPGNPQVAMQRTVTSVEPTRNTAELAPKEIGRRGERTLVADLIAGRHGTREVVVPAVPQKRNTFSTGHAGSEPGDAKARNTLHIGKIEVQITPPPAPVRRVPPPKSKSRLARGYTLWTTWQKQ